MLQSADFPDVTLGLCGLKIERLGEVATREEAWQLLPAAGVGVVVTSDSVRRFNKEERTGLLLAAEVMDGSATWTVRMDGAVWRAWCWRETEGDTHRFVERHYLSTEPHQGEPPRHIYRQYWGLHEDDGIQVMQPVGYRFCGFKEG